MFKQAVKTHNATAPTQKVAPQQQSLTNALKRAAIPATTHATRPLSTGSGNILKHNAAAERTPSWQGRGLKRTSSGLAKALSSQDDFEYPLLSIGDGDFDLPTVSQTTKENKNAGPTGVFFDENDFDSDLDLDVEDPATKGTVRYPSLPNVGSRAAIHDSAYESRDNSARPTTNPPNSSAPIPWSSSPVEHFKTPQKAMPAARPVLAETSRQTQQPNSKRRTLPWLQKQSQTVDPVEEPEPEPEHVQLKKRKSTQSTQASAQASTQASRPGEFTPLPKDSTKSAYPWNTTASAIKQQQKNLREANKKMVKTNEGNEEEVKQATAKRKKHAVHRIFLSEEQQHVLNLIVEHKKSVFFTGSAGTGKSVLLREVISALRKKFIREPDRVAVTASTGLSACNIGGVTLHSFSGIGLGKEPAEDLVKKIRRNPKARQRWMRTKILIVDEVSMVDADLFDKLEQIARTIRNNGRPFGGIQLVITGDFFQLPPVPDYGRVAKFAFDAATWTTAVEHTIGLHHVFRQKDPVFANMLNEMREGRLTPESISSFRKLDRPLPPSEDNIEATELFPTRQEVERANTVRMQQLHGDTFSFEARDGGSITDKTNRDRLLQNCIAPETVHLKKGAQVMLIKNMDDTLVNGSLGRVTGFMTEQMFVLYKENEEAFLQGEDEGPTELEMRAHQKAAILGVNTQQVYPVVRFQIADGTTRDLLCKRESWKVELPNGEVQASREQIPLILAWALSIHKAQGQTLERVRVDLGRVFEKGQAYVALSRATSMGGLQVLRFDPRKVIAHEKVRSFYLGLSRAEQAGLKKEAAKKNAFEGIGMNASVYEKDFVQG